jgi:NAD(P)-dependent dehydrogenase (short-subunit alcohol dehydrogenase family)
VHQWRARNQVIAVTGASMGIGLGTARCLLARGARVALLARDAARLQGVVDGLGSANALAVATDVCDRAAVAAAFERVNAHWGRLDGVINNVGFNFARRIELMPEVEVRRVLERGSYHGGSTTPEVMGEAIAQCFEFPPGVGAEFIEVKSGLRERKLMDTESSR